MVRKASQFPLKLDPQSNDFVVGLDSANPDQFIRIPVGTLPTQGDGGGGIDFEAIPTADGINIDDYVFGATYAIPNELIRIPITLLASTIVDPNPSTGSSQKAINSDFIDGSLTLNYDSAYYQYLSTFSGNGDIILPPMVSGEDFEFEIINSSSNSATELQIKSSNDDNIFLLINDETGIMKGVYLYWNEILLIRTVEYLIP